MHKIVLTTLNARYAHTAIGLRYLYANLKELKSLSTIMEFTINDNLYDIAEKILDEEPQIVAIGAYIWNATEVSRLLQILKTASPEIKILLGGPEASYEPFRTDFSKADYIIQGEGEITFYSLASDLLNGKFPSQRIHKGIIPNLKTLELPYRYYTDSDIENRVIYVEASRGCPFTCEFCLSSIDKKVRSFDLEILLKEFDTLWLRGARNFKFIDRTFNLNIETTNRVLDFFLEKESPYLVHFEVIPDHFPESLKERIEKFPPASLQFEVGIQTLNSQTAHNIKRKLNFEKIEANLKYLEEETHAHLHVDLIVGLPGESVSSFAENLNRLTALTKAEVQIGILKKLSGTTLSRHDNEFQMAYSLHPPYEILQNRDIPYKKMQEMKRFARFWDLTYNSGNFTSTIHTLWKEGKVFEDFMAFSLWIYSETQSTWQISLNRLCELLFTYLTEIKGADKTETANSLVKDILKTGGRKLPGFLRDFATEIPKIPKKNAGKLNKRQLRHADE